MAAFGLVIILAIVGDSLGLNWTNFKNVVMDFLVFLFRSTHRNNLIWGTRNDCLQGPAIIERFSVHHGLYFLP